MPLKSEFDVLKLLQRFIRNCQKGQYNQKNGKAIRPSSIKPYVSLLRVLEKFSEKSGQQVKIRSISKLNKREFKAERKRWGEFYKNFTTFLYNDLGAYDNYVTTHIKRLRSFFNYLNKERSLQIGDFHTQFYCFQEDIDIAILSPEQLNFLIYDKDFESKLPAFLKGTKDLFVFGCTVALRYSDLIGLKYANLETMNGKVYLKVKSRKTGAITRMLLPEYAVQIIQRSKSGRNTLFRPISNGRLNKNLKTLIELTGWKYDFPKVRTRRGIPVYDIKNSVTGKSYRFCDQITTHTMRRTAITTMLCLGMPENAVRLISGHTPGSKEFFKYVMLSQRYMDGETEKVFKKLKSRGMAVKNEDIFQ